MSESREFRDPDSGTRFQVLTDDDLRLQKYEGLDGGWVDVSPSRYALVLLRALARRPVSAFGNVSLAEDEAVFELETAV